MCQNRPDFGNIIQINYQITARLFHILQHMPCDWFVLIFQNLPTEYVLWVL